MFLLEEAEMEFQADQVKTYQIGSSPRAAASAIVANVLLNLDTTLTK